MTQYTFTSLNYPGASGTQANGINNSDEVVGSYVGSDGLDHAFTEMSGTYTAVNYPGGTDTVASGVNDTGEVVGSYQTLANGIESSHGFVDNNGTLTSLDVPNSLETTAEGVNNSGEIVGYYADANNVQHGFVDNNGTFTTIDVPLGQTGTTEVLGVSNSGQIVGDYQTFGTNGGEITHGFVDNNGTFTSIDYPGAAKTSATGINSSGAIVGSYIDSSDVAHGFVDVNGSYTSFDGPSGSGAIPVGVNDAGQIVGAYADPANPDVTSSGFVAAPVCFAAGTLIRTARGDVAVEALAVGDHVVTASGALRPIRWLGHRKVDCRAHPTPGAVRPVRIAAHAFGEGKPARDLYVSPGHAIGVTCLDEVLIPAAVLIDGVAIVQVEVDHVTYWHVELDSHDVILAENLPAESYFEMENRAFFAEAGVVALGAAPDAPARTHDDFCRPYYQGGAIVEGVRARLQARALGRRSVAAADQGARRVA